MFLFSILFLAILQQAAEATTVQRFTLEQMTERAERIFVGDCQSALPELVDGRLYTRYRFAVRQSLKGPAEDTVEFILPGGHFQGTTTHIPGMPIFAPGEETVLFLTVGRSSDHLWPVGLGQGKFRIEPQAGAKPARVFQALDGLSFHALAAKRTGGRASESLQGIPLDEFLDRVRILIAAERGNADER